MTRRISTAADGPFAIVPGWLIEATPDLPPLALPLYALLALMADRDTDDAFPGVPYLARRLGKSERTVQTTMRALEQVGAVSVERRADPEHGQRSNLYHVHRERRQLHGGQQQSAPAPGQPAAPITRTTRNQKGNPTGSPGPAGSALPGMDAPPPPDPVADTAREVTRRVFADRHPRPTLPFPAVQARLRECLDAGWDAEAVYRAGMATRAFSRNALEFQLTSDRGARRTDPRTVSDWSHGATFDPDA